MAKRNNYMLDTDTASYIIKARSENLLDELNKHDMNQIFMSVVTYAELCFGVAKSSSSRINGAVIESFTSNLTVLPWDNDAAMIYGDIRADLESKGKPIGAYDMMIAAHALSEGMILVTNNTKHFKQVSGLSIENWV